MAQVETRHQSEQVQLQALITADGHPENTGQGQLQPGPTGCPRKDLADRQIILADRSLWQRQAELGDLPAKVSDERVAVGSLLHPVERGSGLSGRGLLQLSQGL